ncbi:hypothetical protein ACIQW7_24460 [Peribacillus simplex]|uniref:hypothetical protein n=1 Tax=Peribacillus simplex TaxID=1478 RepID=UPI003800CF09
MEKVVNKTFQNERILLDGTSWITCIFRDCEIVISTGIIEVHSCEFIDCHLNLEGNAANIAQMINLFSTPNNPASTNKFALLVGNGFTLDFVRQYGLDSSFPLKNFYSMDINYSDFIDYLPTIKDELLGQDLNDFGCISKYASKYKVGSFEESQLRRFLAMSYSLFQLKVNQYDMSDWKWVKWLRQNKNELACAISFNYDVLLENALNSAELSYSRVGTNESSRKVHVLKPHGSIDFDVTQIAIEPPTSRWGVTTTLNNVPNVEVIQKSEWNLPRVEADIIPPSMENYQLHLQWVDSMYRCYESISNQLNALVIVGSSYWDVDRKEIDFFLEKLPNTAKVYIMNPTPSEPLIEKIESLGLSWINFNFDELPW